MNLAFQRIILSDIQILHNTLQGYEYCLSYQRHYSAYVQRRLDIYLRFNHFAKIPTLDKLFLHLCHSYALSHSTLKHDT